MLRGLTALQQIPLLITLHTPRQPCTDDGGFAEAVADGVDSGGEFALFVALRHAEERVLAVGGGEQRAGGDADEADGAGGVGRAQQRQRRLVERVGEPRSVPRGCARG